MRILDRDEERGLLKESDINKDEVPVCFSRETSITPLKTRITQKDILCGFGGELVLPRNKNMNKTDN